MFIEIYNHKQSLVSDVVWNWYHIWGLTSPWVGCSIRVRTV